LSTAVHSTIAAKAAIVGRLNGESKAVSHFFKSYLASLPANMDKAKQDAVINQLEAEVGKLDDNVKTIKSHMNEQRKTKDSSKELQSHMKASDRAMMEKMDAWSERSNKKVEMGALDVMSKLKNAIHLIKKGALAGNAESNARLSDVLKSMSAMSR